MLDESVITRCNIHISFPVLFWLVEYEAEGYDSVLLHVVEEDN
jgi:hypothetical protein